MESSHRSFPDSPKCEHVALPVYEVSIDLLDAILKKDLGENGYELILPYASPADNTVTGQSPDRDTSLVDSNRPIVSAGYSKPLIEFSQLPTAQMFTVECGSDNPEEVFVLLSGYGWGSPAYFSTLIKFIELQKKEPSFKKKRLIIMDWMGTAASSRPKWDRSKYDTHHDVAGWFCDSLNVWCRHRSYDDPEAGPKRLVLAGHSVGAYYISRFVKAYPYKNLTRLLLLSPCGFADLPDQYIDPKSYPTKNKSWVHKMARWMAQSHVTPMEFLSCLGRVPLAYFLKGYASRRAGIFFNRDPEIGALVHQWLVANYYATSSADKGYNTTFVEVRAHLPIRHMLADLEVRNIEIYYGSDDWMNPQHTINTLQQMKEEFGGDLLEQLEHQIDEPEIKGPRLPEAMLTYRLSPRKLRCGWDGQKTIQVLCIPGSGHQLMLDEAEKSAMSILGVDQTGIGVMSRWCGVACRPSPRERLTA